MEREYSAGAVVYTLIEGVPHFALVVEKNGDCGLPKGHLEKGENDRAAALREIREELGVSVALLEGFSHVVTYPLRNGKTKQVTYFLATYQDQKISVVPSEVSDAYLLPYEAAWQALKFPKSKRTLELAYEYLMSDKKQQTDFDTLEE